MILHFIKNTLRVFLRNGIYTFINLCGLSIGLSAGILILMYVIHELSYDRFHNNVRNTFLINMEYHTGNYTEGGFTIPAAIAPSLQESFPEILSYARVRSPNSGYFLYADKISQFDNITWVDSSFFSIFSFSLLRGNPHTALSSIYSVVLTERAAGIIFGDEDPVGKMLRLNNARPYIVTGIVENPPTNTFLQFDALLSFNTLYEDKELFMGWDGGNQYYNFITVTPEIDWHALQAKLDPFLYEKINRYYEQAGVQVGLKFEPLRSFHFRYGRLGSGISVSTSIYILSTIALLVLLVACFNFTNLSTARALNRARETGIRKVAGATRGKLILQFLAEALIMSFIAFALALIITELIRPGYNALIGIELSLYKSPYPWFLPSLLLLVFITGIAAGAYPAFFLSSFQPVKVLKGGLYSGQRKVKFSKILVVLQFIISVLLINITLVIFRQMDYIRSYNPGMNTENVLAIHLNSHSARNTSETLQHEIRNLAGVVSCGAASEIPGGGLTSNGYCPEGYKDVVMIHVLDIDDGFLETMGIEVLEGRNFDKNSLSDKTSYIVNETFVKQFSYLNPLGIKVNRNGNHQVIGIVKDFHFSTLHEPVKPLIITNEPWQGFSYLLVRLNPARTQQAITELETLWKRMLPGDPFVIRSVSGYLESSYSNENHFGEIFTWFSALALLVACLGLLGLSSFSIQQRKKEIGLRKIMGASPGNIMGMFARSFTCLVFVANIIALIPAIYIIRKYLSLYSYCINISHWIFIITAVVSLLLAWGIVVWQSLQVSNSNPVEAVKYE